jgi:Ras-related protein Rab-1A
MKWDTAGNQKLRTMVSSYYRGAHAVLIMFDNTNLNTFYSIKNWLKEIKQFAPEKCLKFLICNKIDLASTSDTTTYSSSWMIGEEVKS